MSSSNNNHHRHPKDRPADNDPTHDPRMAKGMAALKAALGERAFQEPTENAPHASVLFYDTTGRVSVYAGAQSPEDRQRELHNTLHLLNQTNNETINAMSAKAAARLERRSSLTTLKDTLLGGGSRSDAKQTAPALSDIFVVPSAPAGNGKEAAGTTAAAPAVSAVGAVTTTTTAHAAPVKLLVRQETQTAALESEGLSSTFAAELLKKFGRNELPEKKKAKWRIFLEQLYQPMPCMIWAAIIVEAAIQSWPDMAILVGIQFMNASLSYYEMTKAGDAVAALKASLKPLAHVKRDGSFVTMDAALLVPGDLVLLGSGGAVPADCVIKEGNIDVDQAALTGESLPVTMYKGDSVKMGSTVVRGEVEGTVEATGANTFFGRTAALLQGGDEVSNLQKLLMRIMIILVVLSMTLCLIAFGYLLGCGESVRDALSFTVVLLVASIPIAIEIVCTTTLALGSRELAKDGAIVSRLAAIEDLAGMSILCSDKTGTLTLNKMVIQEETPLYLEGETQYSILRYAAMASRWKEPPRDALDTLVLGTVDLPSLENVRQVNYMPFDPTVKRTEGSVVLPAAATKGGKEVVFKTTKGAPHVILKLLDPLTQAACIAQVEKDVVALGERGVRALAVAKTKGGPDGPWEMVGLLTFLDPPRPDTKSTLDMAKTYGVEVKMITGDHLLIAKETARQLGLGTHVEDSARLPTLDPVTRKAPADLVNSLPFIEATAGFAQVFPEHKFLIVEALRRGGYKVGMTGDGVNDAPALQRADVGVAVQGATDAARAAADIVLTKPGLSTIVTAIVVARIVFARMVSFLTYRIAATLQLLVFFFVAVLALHPSHFANPFGDWPEFFRMPVLMLMLITLLNDGTLIAIGYDHVRPNPAPDRWNLPQLFVMATALGTVACASSLLLLYAALDSWNPDGPWAALGLPGLTYGQITSMVYLKVSISDFLTLFSSRAGGNFFWTLPPSKVLLGAAFIACSLSTVLANAWPYSAPDGLETEGLARRAPKELSLYVWIYCLLCWLVQDAAKVGTYKVLQMFKGEEGESETMLLQAAREQERAAAAAAGAAAVEVV